MSRFLVTGGAGFIGSHIVETLLKRAHYVRILDNFSSGKYSNIDFARKVSSRKFDLIKGDIRNKNICLKATKGIDYVLHQAALRSVPKSMEAPNDYNEVNINGLLNMLQASSKVSVKCFVFASSSSVYGDVSVFPQKESFLPQPISPYALTKLAGEHYCKIFSKFFKLPAISLRYFNVFGPRQSLDDEYAVVIPKFIHCILHDEQPPIFGTGRQSRDFTYVGNVVNANLAAALKPRFGGEVFNVASGRNYTVLDLVRILNSLNHKNIKPKFLKLRPGDVFKTLADITKTKKLLKVAPRVDFVEGLKLTLKYFKGHD
jgi:nucleoside-diphosphate-sugar epimerase